MRNIMKKNIQKILIVLLNFVKMKMKSVQISNNGLSIFKMQTYLDSKFDIKLASQCSVFNYPLCCF